MQATQASGSIYALPTEVLKHIPFTYRQWTLLSIASKELAGRLGDYHEHHEITFYMHVTGGDHSIPFGFYKGLVRAGLHYVGVLARKPHGKHVMYWCRRDDQPHVRVADDGIVVLWTAAGAGTNIERIALTLNGVQCYVRHDEVAAVMQLFYDEMPFAKLLIE